MNPTFEQMALMVALKKLFNTQHHFCIVDLRRCLDLAGISVPKDRMAAFEALHCVDYSAMPDGFKEELANRVLALFQLPPEFKLDADIAVKQQGWKKLIGL